MNTQHHITHQSSGITYTLTVTTVEEALILVKTHGGQPLSEEYGNEEYVQRYLLEDNQVVEITPIDACIYSSFAGFKTQIEDAKADQGRWKKKIQTEYPMKRLLIDQYSNRIPYWLIDKQHFVTHYPNAIEISSPPLSLETSSPILSFATEKLFRQENSIIICPINYENSDVTFSLFQQEEDYLRYQAHQSLCAIYHNAPVLCGRNPYGEAFPQHVDELILELLRFVELAPEEIKWSNNSRDHYLKIQERLQQHIFTDELVDRVLLPLVAFLGKLQIEVYQCEWVMQYDTIFNTWVPYILKNNKKHNISNKLYGYCLFPTEERYDPFGSCML